MISIFCSYRTLGYLGSLLGYIDSLLKNSCIKACICDMSSLNSRACVFISEEIAVLGKMRFLDTSAQITFNNLTLCAHCMLGVRNGLMVNTVLDLKSLRITFTIWWWCANNY